MATRAPSTDPYRLPLEEKDPLERIFEGFDYAPAERREMDVEAQEDKGFSTYYNLLDQLESTGEGISDERIGTLSFQLASEHFNRQNVTPSKEDLFALSDRHFANIKRTLSKAEKNIYSRAEKLAKQGIVATPEDYFYTEDQRKAIDDGATWYLNEEQAKNRVLRHWASKGILPPEEFSSLLESSIEDIRNNPRIREELKLDLEREHTQPRKGSLPKKEDFIEESWLQSAWMGLTKTVTAPAKLGSAFSASNLDQWMQQGLGKDIVAEARPLKPQEIEYIDAYFEGEGQRRKTMPEHFSKELGGEVAHYMTRGWNRVRGKLPPRWIDENTGLPYERGAPGQKRAVNPEYKKEVEFRKANKPPREERDLGQMTQPDRPWGVSRETFDKYDADLGTAIAQGVRGAFYDPRAPKLEDVLMRVRGAFEKASDAALKAIPLDSPMRERYYGIDEEDRAKKALEMTVAKHGEAISVDEWNAAFAKELKRIEGSHGYGFKDARDRSGSLVFPQPSAEEASAFASEAQQNVLESFGGRLPVEQFLDQYKSYYEHYPHLKMMSDQLKLSDPIGVSNPQMATLLHEVVLDPLWFTGPIKIAKGVQSVRAGWGAHAAKTVVKTGYGLAKEGKYGKTVSSLARGAGELGEGLAEYGADVVAGAKEVGQAIPGVKGAKTGYQWMTEKFTHFTKTGKDYDNLGDLKDDISLMSRVSADAGAGAATKLRSLGDDMLLELNKAKTTEERHILHLVMSGEWLGLYADDIETGTKAWLDPKKASDSMRRVLDDPSKVSPAEQLKIMADEAVRTRYLRPELGEVATNVRKLSDQFYDMAKEQGQLSRIEDGVLTHAKYVNMYVPRWLKNTEKIHDDLVSIGYKDIGEAAYLLSPAGTKDLVAKIVGQGVRQSFDDAVKVIDDLAGTTGDAQSALRGKGLNNQEIELYNTIMGRREEIVKLATRNKVKPEQYFREIASIKRALDNPDYLGQVNLSSGKKLGERIRRKIAGKAAVERKPLGDKYYWLQDPLRQFEAYVSDVSTRAKISGEIKELGRAFGVNKVASVLDSPSMVRISGRGITGTVAERSKKITEVENLLTTNQGIEMVALSPGVSKEVAKVLLQEGAKVSDEAVAFVPKVVANRLDNLLHVVPINQQGEIYKAVKKFRDYAVRPLNSAFRTSRTVLRSPAFHAVNYFGAVGLGSLGLGVDALNPGLQRGAHKMAVSAAFGGSDAARGLQMALPRSATGEVVKIGDALKIMEDYGIINQGLMKYGLDITAGKGWLAAPANMLSETARKFRAQQVAEFSDNYQKAVLFLGHLKSTNRMDIYKTIDFVSEYGQNYNRLTDFERTVMRDMFTFYSWNRFILPHLVRQVYKNPTRLAAFEKMKDVMEYNTKDEAPISGMAIPSFLHMQGAFTAAASMQPKPGEAAPHEYGMGVIEFPMASGSLFAGGFHGESPLHAQLGPVPRLMMAAITGFDYGSGHKWEKEFVLPGLDDFDSLDSMKDYLYNFNDTRAGRIVVDSVPMGGAFLNLAKLYSREGMQSEAAELYMRYRAGRDFWGLDHIIANSMGMKGLSIPPVANVGGLKIPAPWLRLYPVGGLKEYEKRRRRF